MHTYIYKYMIYIYGCTGHTLSLTTWTDDRIDVAPQALCPFDTQKKRKKGNKVTKITKTTR